VDAVSREQKVAISL